MENQLTVIENISDIKSLTVNAMTSNQERAEKALSFGDKLFEKASSQTMDEDMDANIKKYIDKVTLTLKAMNESRKPATQLFDKIKKGFTSLENAISVKESTSVVYKLQQLRNNFAADKIKKAEEERQRIAREQLRLATIENYKNDYKESIHSAVNKAIEVTFKQINGIFSAITIDNIAEKEKEIRVFYDLSFNIKSVIPPSRPDILDLCTIERTAKMSIDENISSACEQYASEVKDFLDDLLIRLSSKKKELEKIAKQNEEDARKAKEELARRDAEEAARKEIERKEEEEKRKQAESLAAGKSNINNLFDVSAITPATNAKVTKKIEIVDARGFLNIIQLWWMGEGINMNIEDLSKKLKFAVTYAEKQANKENLIESPYINYIDDVKAK